MDEGEYLIAKNILGTYCVPVSSKHRPVAHAVLSGEVWEPETIAFMSKNCAGGDIVHAGTYYGDFLPALSRATAVTGGRVWAFEPSSENFRCAEITIKLNDLKNVTLTNAGLGAKAGALPLMTRPAGGPPLGGSSRLVEHKMPGSTYENVKIVTIDESVPQDRPIAILQLDVEGFEEQALQGGMGTIRRTLPIIILERLPHDEAWFAQTVLSLGYVNRGNVHKNKVFSVRDVLLGG